MATNLEVQLAWEVMTCLGLRSTYDRPDSPCHWFNRHYGPYPAYSLQQAQPRAALERGESRELAAISKGMRYPVPELLSGCRKAPIMSLGINPNLTAYQHNVKGATWCYPYFDDLAKYADHFRNRTVNQESFPLEFIKKNLVAGSTLVAEADGQVSGVRLDTDNVAITVQYANGTSATLRVPVDYVLVCDTSHKSFHKGDVLAGRLLLPEDTAVQVTQEPVGYYTQFQACIERFKRNGDAALQRSQVQLGEDACQGDMVCCASPGWNAYFPDEVCNGIVRECVEKRRHLARQLAQSRPAIIVFAGTSSLQMFLELYGQEVQPAVDLSNDNFVLLRKCRDTRFLLRYSADGVSFVSRLIFSPHFSYPDNFIPGCRMTAAQWDSFKSLFPADAEKLASHLPKVFSGVLVTVNPNESPWSEVLSPGARALLTPWYLDPVELIAQVLGQEYKSGLLRLDARGEHLVRTDGPCCFCRNALFELPGGCRYGKLDSEVPPHTARIDR